MLLECLDARRATRGMKGVPDCEAPVALQNKDKVVMSMTIMTLENSEDNIEKGKLHRSYMTWGYKPEIASITTVNKKSS